MALVHEKVVEGMKKAAEVLPKVAPIASALLGSNNIVHAAANVLAVPFVAHTIAEKAADTLKSKVGRLPLTASVGAPPALVTRDDVRAYETRVDAAVETLNSTWHAWLTEVLKRGKFLPDDQIKFNAEWPAWYSKWKVWLSNTSGFDLLGPSPSAAWEETQVFETQLEEFRKRFAGFTTDTNVKAPLPFGQLENPGGVQRKGIFESISDAVPWKTLIFAGVAVAGVAIYVNRPHRAASSTA